MSPAYDRGMSTRLFHTVVLVGVSVGVSLLTVSCGGTVDAEQACQDAACEDAKSDSFPHIAADTAPVDTWDGIRTDTTTYDSWGGIRPADTGVRDTWGGIRPADIGVDTWPTIAADTSKPDAPGDGRDASDAHDDDTWPGILPPPADTRG